jgi:glyoxylase-like metal-dependent hydrolase (beta-lactamase superfamily II)
MRIHMIPGIGFSGNIFLADTKKPCLIDTGWDTDISYAGTEVKKILGKKRLACIILTHRHIDHVGGAKAFQQTFGGEMLAHSLDTEALLSGDPISTGARLFGGSLEPLPVKKLDEGDKIDLGGGESLSVIHTPGHTIGGMCLLSGSGEMFTGDTVFAGGDVGRWDLETGDYSQLLASVEKISKLDVESLYPGHGPCAEGDAKEHLARSFRYLKSVGRFSEQ